LTARRRQPTSAPNLEPREDIWPTDKAPVIRRTAPRRSWHWPGFCPAPPYIVPIPDTSHRHRLEENAAAVSLKISADTEDALLQVFAPGAANGLRYPENHLMRLGI
jgi:hypothetical protein